MARVFGNFHKIVANDELRPSMAYVVVRDGNLFGTDGHVLIKIPIKAWLEHEEELEHVEGKAFHYKLLVKLAATKWKKIEFTADKINFYNNQHGEVIDSEYYSAICVDKENRKYNIIDSLTGKLCWKEKEDKPDEREPDLFGHPNIESAIPQLSNQRNSFTEFGINHEFLSKLAGCFRGCLFSQNLKLQFTPQHKDDEHIPYPKRAIIVTPVYNEHEEFGVIMPVQLENE